MRRYLKALFCGQDPEDVFMFSITGCLVVLAVLTFPLWVLPYVIGRTFAYLYAKEYK